MIRLNPYKIVFGWILIILVVTPVRMYISNIGHSDGEQIPIGVLAEMLFIASIGVTVLSIVTPFLFQKWFKSNWLPFSIIIVLASLITLKLISVFYYENL